MGAGRQFVTTHPVPNEEHCEYIDPLGKRCGHEAQAHISPASDFGLPYEDYCAACQLEPDPIGPQFVHVYMPPQSVVPNDSEGASE